MIDDAKQKPGPRRPHRRSRHAIVGQCEAQPIAARLGADLLEARRSLRLTQAGLASRVGISLSAITMGSFKWAQRGRPPRRRVAFSP